MHHSNNSKNNGNNGKNRGKSPSLPLGPNHEPECRDKDCKVGNSALGV